ncbi:rod shape-determining protein MreC [Acidovorax sp. SUPP950]|uniref:rod shape-determining protein MreC n=1 Tax=unclassified Acidovorax TaxID=2684926 RepID=UPI00234A82DD|nr:MULTISPECIES: rod shape-determining protein MreC [Comamonadaceae]WCM97508.1 rod shape-determining protein MreC [Acidovorax sp. GBBC 1281]WOI46572.1 rod shape-determining protein MreC [Paracidovorax avenae]GKS75993.1 rod shape-determining protein MreC [Acidovorax sp. SUPP950]GKS87199.1 rod shape-determining protein MreC [Acidovorax sp. SUPP1855]GKS89897.1 rod shape-determining protein MreC [Acidovorax sp. SUPP2539]
MPLGTLERSAPPFFKQGPSPRSRLALYSALALFLMVADARFQVTDPLRKAVAVALYPLQWTMLQPVEFAAKGAGYFQSLQVAQADADTARRNMAQMSERANQAEQLLQENARLRKLLELRERLTTPSQAAQVIYDAADPYTRRVMIDQGQVAGVELGSPVMDESGMLGQVTRVHPFLSEVTLLIDRDQAIPVMNLRTGARSVAYGDPVIAHGGGMELRFMPGNADVQENDLLTTSGVDGLYPPGLPVARVVRVERRADSAFARIYCAPLAQVNGARHVLVLKPLTADLPQRPAPAPAAPVRKGRR